MEEMHSLPVHEACKDALMALLLSNSIIRSSDTDERIIKAMDELPELPDFVIKSVKEHSETKFNRVIL
jgi:hypothetical protein